jgi:hypothetical protein
MCYQERLFKEWLTKKAHKRQQPDSLTEAAPLQKPPRTVPQPTTASRRDRKRELEEAV